MKTAWKTSDVREFFVTGPTAVAAKPKVFTAAFVVRTSLFSLMGTMRFCDNSRAVSICQAINI